ncbi:hypothetical protein P9850_12160 [Anoxybacillus rupiensis]|uniref:Uncharacterized protein n=1 Tax=Anoxybacteroides rupiense TaxID=311460 RepID=A0ABD5IXC7_9BACL|nr:hypothetical protein [Anoxybacillus rupiensis]
MKQIYINHITLNSGHIRKSFPSEIDKELYFLLMRVKREIFMPKGAEIWDGYIARGTDDPGNGAVITVFDRQDIPVITIGMTKHKNSTLWEILHSTSMLPLQTNPARPPEPPYVADRIEIGAIHNIEAMRWTGDFSKCMAWVYLAPEAIR